MTRAVWLNRELLGKMPDIKRNQILQKQQEGVIVNY